MKALVVFVEDNSHPLSWMLKKGFKHCFICLNNDGLWLLVDAAKGVPVVKYLCEDDFDLKNFYTDKGFTVIESEQGKALKSPLVLRNCVGMVKSVLCKGGFSVTPYGLYKRLI